MAGYRGYSNYRGRKSKVKAAVTVLLVLVILIAVVVMLLQRHVVYDEAGMPHLEIPWQQETPAEEETPDMGKLDLTLEEQPEAEEELRGYAAPEGVLTTAVWEEVKPVLASEEAAYNAVAVTLKDHAGNVYFDSGIALTRAVKTEADTAAVLAELTASEAYTAVARIACFHDPRVANGDVEGMGLKNTGGYIFYDGNNSQWLDPAKPAARRYLCELAEEAARLGFDEILLTDVSYPTEGKLDKVDYGTSAKTDNLEEFLEEMRAVLEPYGTALSVEVPEAVLTEGRDDTVGLTLIGVAKSADRIYAAVPPETAQACAAAAETEVAIVSELTAYDPAAKGPLLILG